MTAPSFDEPNALLYVLTGDESLAVSLLDQMDDATLLALYNGAQKLSSMAWDELYSIYRMKRRASVDT